MEEKEFLVRAKTKDKGIWITGFLIKMPIIFSNTEGGKINMKSLIERDYRIEEVNNGNVEEIDYTTLCKCPGLELENRLLFEGDILLIKYCDGTEDRSIIKCKKGVFYITDSTGNYTSLLDNAIKESAKGEYYTLHYLGISLQK